MALSKLDNLYRQVILDHAAHPHHHGEITNYEHTVELRNPTCGDVLQVAVKLEDSKIQDIRFSGSGCTISQASASMMTDVVLDKTIDEAKALIADFSKMMTSTKEPESQLGDAAILVGVKQFPARIKCATLAWKALEKALQKEVNHD